jgi:hypothetical protein
MFGVVWSFVVLIAPPHVDADTTVVRVVQRLHGAILVRSVHPGMSQRQVRRVLGEPDTVFFSGWMTVWAYRRTGIQVFWYTPVKLFAPTDRLGPRVMGVLRAIPSGKLQGMVLLFSVMRYSPAPALKEVRWVGLDVGEARR